MILENRKERKWTDQSPISPLRFLSRDKRIFRPRMPLPPGRLLSRKSEAGNAKQSLPHPRISPSRKRHLSLPQSDEAGSRRQRFLLVLPRKSPPQSDEAERPRQRPLGLDPSPRKSPRRFRKRPPSRGRRDGPGSARRRVLLRIRLLVPRTGLGIPAKDLLGRRGLRPTPMGFWGRGHNRDLRDLRYQCGGRPGRQNRVGLIQNDLGNCLST